MADLNSSFSFDRLELLFNGYMSKTLSPDQRMEFLLLIKDPVNEQRVNELIEQFLPQSFDSLALDPETSADIVESILQVDSSPIAYRPSHRVHFLRRGFLKYAAAIILIVGATTIALIMTKDRQQLTSETTSPKNTPANDILPGTEKAVLTLADGSTIQLDRTSDGNIAQQGNANVIKLANGEIRYDVKGISQGDVMMNTMSTPRGGQYKLTLPDGSKVWLNAASSITYPAVFAGKNRKVKISGEAYMEVTSDKSRPFMVDIDGKSSIQVLGTSFNVNSYADEGEIKTTLVDGSVKVNNEVVLTPGQQSTQFINPTTGASLDRKLKITNANIDQALAWKEGIFDFTGADLRSVMKQLERWYDIKVQYKGVMSNMTFDGRMYRNVNLSDVLQVLQKMGVRFELEEKNLIIL